MLRFPLHTQVMLITTGGKFIGKITHASDNLIRITELVERIITPSGDYLYTDNELSGVFHFCRSHIVGFKSLEGNEVYELEQDQTSEIKTCHREIIAKNNRQCFQIIKKVKSRHEQNHQEGE